MASLAEKRMEEAEDRPADEATDPVARPEELRLLEALLFASAEPIDQATLAKRMPDGVDVKVALAQLQAEYAPRGVNLVRVANKWTFRTAGDLSWLMTRESTETRRLSRAAIEVLAIIAYHQPVTRAEIEEIRGVITSKGTLDVLLETGWIRPRGRRKTPGRPLTFGTTEAFPVAVQPGGAGRPAGPRRAEGHGPAGFAAAFRIQRSDAVGRCGAARGRRPAGCGRQPGTVAGAGRRARRGRRKLVPKLRQPFRQAGLMIAIIRSRDSDLPRQGSLFLTPPGPTFRQSLAGFRPSLFGGLQDGFA